MNLSKEQKDFIESDEHFEITTGSRGYITNNVSHIYMLNYLHENYKIGQFIYPRAVSRNLPISYGIVLTILSELYMNGLIGIRYEIYCATCDRHQGDMCTSINEALDKVCENCGKDITESDVQVVYVKKG